MITLPVSVVVGDHPMPVGELDLDAQEVSPHGTAP